MGRVVQTAAELEDVLAHGLPARKEPTDILMCAPDAFDVIDVKNVFMTDNIGRIDKRRARLQWEALVQAFESLGKKVHVLPAVPDQEDMVFTANPVLPYDGPNGPGVVLSRMRFPVRQREVHYHERFFHGRGYEIRTVHSRLFEGQGDALWLYGKRLLLGGYGHRTERETYDELAEVLDTDVVLLELPKGQAFYHLDTCLAVVDEETAIAHLPAFTEDGRYLLRRLFPRLVETTDDEARTFFACNATALDGRTVVLQRGAERVVRELGRLGLDVLEVDTSEFMLSGGSVFCMKLLIY